MNITKAQADKVIAALEDGMRTCGEDQAAFDALEDALTIMRGLAEDAEPDVWRSQLEGIVDIYLDGTTKPHEDRAYCEGAFDSAMNDVQKMLAATSPQAAQTALQSESLAQAAQALARLPSEGKPIEALALTEAQEREAFEAEFDQLCKDYSIYGLIEARLCKVFFEAGRAGRKG